MSARSRRRQVYTTKKAPRKVDERENWLATEKIQMEDPLNARAYDD